MQSAKVWSEDEGSVKLIADLSRSVIHIYFYAIPNFQGVLAPFSALLLVTDTTGHLDISIPKSPQNQLEQSPQPFVNPTDFLAFLRDFGFCYVSFVPCGSCGGCGGLGPGVRRR